MSDNIPRNNLIPPTPTDEEEDQLASLPTISQPNGDDLSRSRSRSRSPANLRSRKPPPPLVASTGPANQSNGHLSPPSSFWRSLSRSPSPLGLIPIHRTFSRMIHKYEVPRKALHVSIGFLVYELYRRGFQPKYINYVLVPTLTWITSADLLRFYSEPFNKLYIRVFGALMRETEVREWNGVVWYLLGAVLVLAVFPKDIATLSIILLSWCDTAASTFGRLYGRYTPRIRRGKSMAGSLASFAVGTLAAGWFLGWVIPQTGTFPDDPPYAITWHEKLGLPWNGAPEANGKAALGIMSVATGLIASVSEIMDVWGFDDNIVIPVASALGIWGFLKIFG